VDGPIPDNVTSINVELAQMIAGSDNAVPITQKWSTDSIGQGFQGRFIRLPMTKNSSGIWETEITWANDLPDQMRMLFSSGTVNDRNDGNSYWSIDPEYKDFRIELIDPNMCTPSITTSGSTLIVTSKGPASTTDWKLNITGMLETPISLSEISSENVGTDWNVTFTLPSLQVGLYDLTLYATHGGKVRSDFEPHSLRIEPSIPTAYTIAIFGDQEIDSSGARGAFDLSQIMSDISIVNPLFTVNLGSLSLWGDEPTFRLYRDYLQEFLSVPQYMATGHRERFEGSEGDWPNWGMGMGAFERIVGPRHRDWWVGDHFFTSIYPGDHRPDDSEIAFLDSSLSSGSSANMKTIFLHDPIKHAWDPEGPSYIPTQMFEQCIRLQPAEDILGLMESNSVDYYVHSSIGIDGSAVYQGVQHISVTSAGHGFSLIKVSNDGFDSWGNGTGDGTFPLGKLQITYNDGATDVDNDGTHSTLIGKLTNDHSEAFTDAKISFKMPNGDYDCTGGIIENQYRKDGYTYVNVLVDVPASGFVEATVEPAAAGVPIRTKSIASNPNPDVSVIGKISSVKSDRAGWTPLNPSVGDIVTIWYVPVEAETTTTTETTTTSSASLNLVSIILGVVLLTQVRKRK
jgi:hypothetical protein